MWEQRRGKFKGEKREKGIRGTKWKRGFEREGMDTNGEEEEKEIKVSV